MSSTSPQDPSVSCLVISRTANLLNRLLPSLNTARSFWNPGDEVLCSWNGATGDEAEIKAQFGPSPAGQPAFRIAQRCAYHFASNMNALAQQASGELLVFLNDDLILDPGSLDHAIQVLQSEPGVGLVGGRLRSSKGLLTHAGLLLANDHVPYNRFRPDDLGPLLDVNDLAVQESGPMPAVTGALMVMRRSDFLTLRFHDDYRVCGEDIALCLDVWTQLGKHPYYASDVTAIHDEKTTRGDTLDYYDIRKLAAYAAHVTRGHTGLQTASHHWAGQESELMWKLVQRLRHERDSTNQNYQHYQQAMAEERQHLEQRIAVLETHIENAEATIRAIQTSSSWQLTAPLRLLGDKLRDDNNRHPSATATELALPTINPDTSNITAATERLNLIFDSLVLGQANRATVSRGGIYRYASELLVALSQESDLAQILPYCPDPLLAISVDLELQTLERRFQVHLRSGASAHKPTSVAITNPPAPMKRLLKSLYRHLLQSPLARNQAQKRLASTMQKCSNADTVFHTPFQSVPQEVRQSGLEAVVITIHDMLPRIHPEFFTSETIRQFDALLDQLQPSDHVICVSESTKRDFLHCHPSTPADQVHVTPLAASSKLQPVSDTSAQADLRRQLGLQPEDIVVLSLCTLEPRKNLTTLISAFEQLCNSADGSALKLVLAGSLGWKTTTLTEQLRTSRAAESIVVSGHIPDEQLACLYSLADAFVYPSVYEGFGLPPLEAMHCGTPVIVGNTSSLPEVVGDAAVLVDPLSPADLKTALADLLGSVERRQTLSQAGLVQAARFSWSNTARRTADIYRTVLECRG